ncbi:AsmA family protein [Roseibium sp.]|uniref:AsmA family protein n=1 Tax=Roseibium sp. TaxID=1936156 RepID=UPI003B517A5E
MKRLLVGLGSLLFVIVTALLVVPFFLPKDQIKQQVVQQIDNRFGWRIRLDGPVSLSLLPGFQLTAEDIGISGEAGADGIEFAKAKQMEFGLAWAGLLSGNIQVTGITLIEPDIYLEKSASGATSWEPRKALRAQPIGSDSGSSATESASQAQDSSDTPAVSNQGYLESIGVDRVEISNGKLTYIDGGSNQNLSVQDLNLTLNAPDLAGSVDLASSFLFEDIPLEITGSLTNPLGLVSGDQVPVDLSFSSTDNVVSIKGNAGLEPPRADLALAASGPSLKALAALGGQQLDSDPGAFKLDAQLAGSEAAVSIADLHLVLGALSLGGAADADLTGLVPEVSGRLVLKDGSISDLLLLAGQDLPASGQLSADLAFETVGMSSEELVAGLDMNGSVSISDGEIGGIGLADAVGGDPEADRITGLSLDIEMQGLESPLAARGALNWRGEGFSVTGEADTSKLLAGDPGAVSVSVKGNRVTVGFDGSAQLPAMIDGAARIKTADLRGLMAWMGQPLADGGGLKAFSASGIFGFQGDTVSFEETRFTLDETSGEANGKVTLGGKPSVTARLDLKELVLDPYFGSGTLIGNAAATQSGTGGAAAPAPQQAAGGQWSTAPVDYSGLKAANVDFKATTQAIRLDKIRIGESALVVAIKDGVLNADLQKLSLYEGSGTGSVRLDGAVATPALAARFDLAGLNAYPLLRDAADFTWIEGKTRINLDVSSSGASEQQMVQNLKGTAGYVFEDGAIRGINIPQMVRGLSVETLLGWQANPSAKTDFSSLSASFRIENGLAHSNDLSLIGPLLRMTGQGTTDMPNRRISWRVEPKIVATLEGQAPMPRRKGTDKKLASLGVPIMIEGTWADPRIYPDIAGILEDPEAAYKKLQEVGGELISILNGEANVPESLADTANQVIERATGGQTQINIEKVIEGDVNDEEVLKAVEEGFGLPEGLLGNVFGGKKKEN